ncbi:jumonji domain containing 5 [Cordyceps fumosorosea ARSEF 2679]|uniref:Jumonji domain containing 5 n=1 Tax=Cordyceps fumosorosea (strain ARSEF 2679) TaxID=1081104 RepID=A0A167V939_CORFA|nr:jumonji domain containing 5 [Cordyceps fumosorosea ARSEF 2679]OAA62361.1 jumonji domain containing 5 [Cordyceps fumosorosea ARSEF 2679]
MYYHVLSQRLHDVEVGSHARLYAYPLDAVPVHWRQIYSDVQILSAFLAIIRPLEEQRSKEHQRQAFLKALDEVVARLDRALIISGGAGRILGKTWIDKAMELIAEFCTQFPLQVSQAEFSFEEPYGRPRLTSPCERHHGWDLARFEMYMSHGLFNALETGAIGPKPVVFTDLTGGGWPALLKWCRPQYLFHLTLGGRRLVPVEIGRSYVDDSWGQELMPFKEFVTRFIDSTLTVTGVASAASGLADSRPPSAAQTGYLAQHDLFQQIPELRNDILVPDFCWAQVPALDPITGYEKQPKLDMPRLNAWFGPAGTNSPLHTDPYHNLFCQVVGTKYVRLYPPQASKAMRPMATSDGGIDMSNTSSIDLLAVEGWAGAVDDSNEEAEEQLREIRDSLKGVEFFECILQPGDTLLIPMGWWHFVRSLSVSFSVSFWWN